MNTYNRELVSLRKIDKILVKGKIWIATGRFLIPYGSSAQLMIDGVVVEDRVLTCGTYRLNDRVCIGGVQFVSQK